MFGSSTGIREHSASRTRNKATATNNRTKPASSQSAPLTCWCKPVNSNQPDLPTAALATATSPNSSAGSASAEKKTSRLAPIPSNAEPVSKAAATVKNLASPSRYANSTKSPAKWTGASQGPNGTSSTAAAVAASVTIGPARNTHDVVRLYTAPLPSSLRRS